MDSLLLIIVVAVLVLLVVLLALLLIALQRWQANERPQQNAQSKLPTRYPLPAPQSERTERTPPSTEVTISPVGSLVPLATPPKSLAPDHSRFATEPGSPARTAPVAFTEVVAQKTSRHSYGHSYISKANPNEFEWQNNAGPLPQVPGYRFLSTSGVAHGTYTLYKATALDEKPEEDVASDGDSETFVAIKVINPAALATAQSFQQKFDQQLAIGYTIRHPNCAAVLGGNADITSPYVIEEWLSGGSLREAMTPGQPMTASDITRIIGQICNALAYLHKRNIVHQAISPEHLHFDARGHLHLIHCAFARLLAEVKRTPMGVVMGDVTYLSAEHMGGPAMTPRSDLYSLGVLAYELATGQPPFAGSDVEVIRQHMDAAPPDPRLLNRELSEDMALAIMKALQKDPAKRFQNARDMARAFGFSEVFDGFKEATNLLFVPPTARTPSPYLSDNAMNPYDFSLARRSVKPQATDVLKMRNVATGITVAVNTTRAVVTRDLINPRDAMISRTNGQIYLQDGHWWISELPDAPSQNGLFVNESRITEPRPIHLGDKLRVGKTTLQVIP
ncbi:MAG: protein kinase [Anaerolineae bacterium]|nr:protein kinase [Anaerolineae bacterium]